MEKDYTTTYHQTSLAIKSILAQMVNTILIPVITAYKIKNNVYLASGLVDNIFMLSISLSILPPIMIYFDSWAIILWIIKKCKSTSGNCTLIQIAKCIKIRKNSTLTSKDLNSK